MFFRLKPSRLFSPVILALLLLVFPSLSTAQARVTKIPDLNGDGSFDLIWHNPATGQSVAWLMNGISPSNTAALPSDPNWKIAAAADFNGDGMTDLVWSNASNGQIIEWLMNGTSVASSTLLLEDPLWKLFEAADLNGDGMADLVLFNASTGQTVAWIMNGTTITRWSLLLTDPNWKVIATADFNGDGMADLAWYNENTGETVAWIMNGTSRMGSATLLTDPDWKIIAFADFNGDRMADILWYNAAIGETDLWLMNGTTAVNRIRLQPDSSWTLVATGDMNGDGMADLLWNNAASGQTSAWLMNGPNVASSAILQTDLNWKINATADLNGDKKSDLLWYNAATGQTAVWIMDGTTGTKGANLFTDPNWRLQCIKSSSITPALACNDALSNASTGNAPMPPNQPPVVNAGMDQTITVPAVANLSGAVTDDGIPIGLVTSMWSQVAGPGTVGFGNAASLNTTATFSAAGTYTLRLRATDSQLSASNDIVITVGNSTTGRWKKNQPPVVDGGPDQTITLPAAASLLGSVMDDGLPYKQLTAFWSKVKGPGNVNFSNAKSTATSATFSAAGTYTLRLTANDGALSRSDDILVVVDPSSTTNKAPVVNAGPDQMITLPAAANLSGTATDDGLPLGSTISFTWTYISGPGTVVFSAASSLNPTATFSAAGTYTLRLSVSDGKATTTDDMIVVVSASTGINKAPAVNAGPDQTVTLPAGPTLSGTATDDGLPTGSTISVSWTKVGGPGTVVFVNVNSLNASAVMSTAGTYTLRLTASDGALSSSDDVIVTVNPVALTNTKPVVNAGPDQTITLPASATLAGSATDDGLPTGSTLTKSWSTVSGPGSVTFGNAAAPNTTATFSTAGVYTLRLSASDSALAASDDVIITVNSAPPVNQAPFVNAGPDFTIALPNGITLAGSATDDGLPTGSTLTKSWSKVSGPGTVTFGNAATLNSTANFSAAGIYTLRLTASDSLLSASDDVVFTVNAAPATNLAPVVNAGPDQTTNSNSVNASATFSVPGNYTLRLTTSDGAITSFDDMNVVVNSCGTGVSGTKTIVATVTDSVGVTSVQMKLDGANMGSNITSAPYSILWNTTTTSNGCHVLSVVAQDAAGNQGTASVSTVVNN
jgi:PKD repeat protein